MKCVVDTNILFSFFWKNSLTKKLLITTNLELISPEIALKEIKNYKNEIIRKTKISEINFTNEFKKLKLLINFVKKENYGDFIGEAIKISPDKNDSEFFALCLKHDCFLWSNDKILKNQEHIKVLSTKEIIEILF